MAIMDITTTKVRESVIYAEAQAMMTMAEAHTKKVAFLKEQNLMMLMTMLNDVTDVLEVSEYFVLR